MPIRPRFFLLSTVALCLQFGASIVIANANVLHYDNAMKSPPWATKQIVENNDNKLKEEFAELLLRRPHEPFEVAKLVTGDDERLFGTAFERSRSWPNDPYVREHQRKLEQQFGRNYFLPTKEEIIHEWWYRVRERDYSGTRKMSDKDAIAASTLIGNMAGYLTKGAGLPAGDDNSVNITQTVEVTFVAPDTTDAIDNIKTIDNVPAIDSQIVPLGITFED